MRNNLAYDEQKVAQQQKSAQIREVRLPSKKQRISVAKAAVCLLMIVSMTSLLIYAKVIQTELSGQYDQTVEQINQVKSDNARLQIQLESKLSLGNIENIAQNNMGLSKLRSEQIQYVQFNEPEKAEVVRRPSFFASVASFFQNLFA